MLHVLDLTARGIGWLVLTGFLSLLVFVGGRIFGRSVSFCRLVLVADRTHGNVIKPAYKQQRFYQLRFFFLVLFGLGLDLALTGPGGNWHNCKWSWSPCRRYVRDQAGTTSHAFTAEQDLTND